MGNIASTVSAPIKRFRMKRKYAEDDDEDNDSDIDRQLSIPKRRKLMSTSHYIHKALYQEGQNSDIVIRALGVEWKLHRVYLCQSPYFASMFSGAWRETNDDEISIEIVDPNITIKALDVVFGSLYQDEITIEPSLVVSVLAAATLFQLESVINQAIEIMKETTNIQTAVKYWSVTHHYGYMGLFKSCFNWLLVNLLGCLAEQPKWLRDVNQDLLIELLSSPDLYVMQTEFSTYFLLKMWTFLKENLIWDGNKEDCVISSHNYFKDFEGECFLLSETGEKYQPLFKALRLEHLINHHFDVEMLERDRIIPRCWFDGIFRQQWYRMLRVDQGVDKGPKNVPEEDFKKLCFRCGRILTTDGFHLWRWTGFNFGLDILVTYDKRNIKFRRNHRSDAENQSSLSLVPRRHVMYRLTVASVDEQKQIKSVTTTGLRHINLGKNEEVQILHIDETTEFPLFLSANFMVTSTSDPLSSTSLNKECSGSTAQIPSFSR